MFRILLMFFLVLIGFTQNLSAQVLHDIPPFGLTVEQTLNWQPNGKTSAIDNVSRVPLARRFVDRKSQLNSALNPNVKVLIAPDGMNNLGNYIDEQNQFNLYNFTHWAQIDVLNWFAGTADLTVNIPSRPWVEAAHKNGVKVIGSVYLAVAQWGGSSDTVAAMLVRDDTGRFPMAHKLIEIAEYYGFDGWLINQETDLSVVKDANNELIAGVKDYNRAAFLGREMRAFVTYLTQIASGNLEIHWYDAQIEKGTVAWQNTLNSLNAPFFGSRNSPASDAIFINYWWNKTMVSDSRAFAERLGRDPYSVYTGVDLWPERNAQRAFVQTKWLDDIYSDKGKQGLTSIALFANNLNYNFSGNADTAAYSAFFKDQQDYRSFYDTETRLFSGDSLNISTAGQQKWKGLSHYVPARSVLMGLPFSTTFNTGHGKFKAKKGQIVSSAQWHDISKQDILPTWQFSVSDSDSLSVFFDFENAYQGGSSLKLSGSAVKNTQVALYKTRFDITDETIEVIAKGQGEVNVVLHFDGTKSAQHNLSLAADWQSTQFSLNRYAGRQITRIALAFENGQKSVDINIGSISIE